MPSLKVCSYFKGTLAPPFGGNVNNAETKSSFPGLPEWIDLNIIVPVSATIIVVCVGILVVCVALSRRKTPPLMNPGYSHRKSFSNQRSFLVLLTVFIPSIAEEYAQFYGAMTMKNGMVTMNKNGLPYDEMGYSIGGPPNRYIYCALEKSSATRFFFRKLPPVPGKPSNSNYNTIDRIKQGKKR